MKPKIIYAILGATATGFLLGWIIFGLILGSYYKTQVASYAGLMKDPPEFWAIAVMNLSYAVLLVYIFHTWAHITTFGKGFSAGLVIFLLIMIGFDISSYAFMNLFSVQILVVDIIANTFLGGVVGGVAGLLLGTGQKQVR
jgi:hypothetical protein